VLIQKDDVVRLIDLGQAKTLRGVGTRSVSVAGGTPDYQPDSVLRGEERLAAWVDIHALASVAFHALTDKAPGKKESDARGNASALRDARVPSAVARVLRKALREKDQRKETDPELYTSAAAVARDLHAWREGQARRAQRKRQGIAALLIALLMLIPTWVGWSRYWAEIRADQTRELVSLRAQASRLSHDDHPRVKQLTERIDQLEQADVITPQLLDTLRQVISLRRGLERCLPLRQALGEVLTRAPWVDEAEAIATERKALEQRFTEIGAQIERGNTDAAWVGLGTLNAALADLARRNVQAARVAEPRARYKRAVTGLSAQLRERGAADPEFTRLSQTANAAEEAWKAGDWPTAERLFGLAHQALDGWLDGKETSEQLAARRLAEGASAVAAANRERALRWELARLEQLEKDLTGQVQGLQAQIARLTDQNLKDRDAYVAASKDVSSERARRASAETQVKNLTASLDQEREALKTAETALATERSAKEAALSAQATAESERDASRQQANTLAATLATKEAALKLALADLASRNTGIPATPGQNATGSSTPVAGWQGVKAGDLKVLRHQNQELRFRWCPAGSFKMGSPPSELDRFDDEDQVDVTLTHGFWMLETEVTQGLWQAVMGSKLHWSGYGEGADFPVYNVSYREAESFAATLTQRLREAGQLASGWKLALPTEAQWEYAARAATTTRFPFGDQDQGLAEYAWYSGNSGMKTHAVRTREPNGWGLRDMLGNVWGWCADGYQDKLPGGQDPCVLAAGAPDLVFRGGSWSSGPWSCRPACRHRCAPVYRNGDLGFRVAAVQK